jgi:transcription elongation factor Elf1
MCPECGKGKVLKLTPQTRAKNLIVFCKRCGRESTVNIDESLCPCRVATSA